jgi:predicted mannosyl-3-phosphoglycerate phosphatase (HAD superfamily)
LRTSTIAVYCAIDSLISLSGKALTGFPEFLEGLSEASIPCVWVTSRNRMYLDATLRKFGHGAPFIGESGSGVYMPEDYFHLRPAKTTRLGRFTCIPVAALQPAARDALDVLAEETGVEVVPLRSLSPRELSQNVGLPQRDAELLRQRDFDEVFFFAGATEDIEKFRAEAVKRNLSLHAQGLLWALACGANLATCVRDLSKLYDRAVRGHAFTIAIGTAEDAIELFAACDRGILLTNRKDDDETEFDEQPEVVAKGPSPKRLPLFSPDTWETVLEAVQTKLHS